MINGCVPLVMKIAVDLKSNPVRFDVSIWINNGVELTSLCSSMPTASPPPIPMTPIYRDSKTMIPAMFSLLIPSTL